MSLKSLSKISHCSFAATTLKKFFVLPPKTKSFRCRMATKPISVLSTVLSLSTLSSMTRRKRSSSSSAIREEKTLVSSLSSIVPQTLSTISIWPSGSQGSRLEMPAYAFPEELMQITMGWRLRNLSFRLRPRISILTMLLCLIYHARKTISMMNRLRVEEAVSRFFTSMKLSNFGRVKFQEFSWPRVKSSLASVGLESMYLPLDPQARGH